jgi:hypothetical protein
MELKRVGSIAMSRVPFQILWKVDDINGLEWTLFDANTAT